LIFEAAWLLDHVFRIFEAETIKSVLKIGKILSVAVVLIMSIDVVGAAVTVCPAESIDQPTLTSKRADTSLISSLFIEKAEEENEKSEEEKQSCSRIVLVDFSQIAFSLARFHTPHLYISRCSQTYDVRPPLYAFHCIFII
jgi:hypothetical protein